MSAQKGLDMIMIMIIYNLSESNVLFVQFKRKSRKRVCLKKIFSHYKIVEQFRDKTTFTKVTLKTLPD